MPELKQEHALSPDDFVRHQVWLGVHNFDFDQSWYEQADEETFRPWTGSLPFSEARGFVLTAASFTLADGTIYGGYCRSVREDWDQSGPLQSNQLRDNSNRWSSRHGGDKRSVLLLQHPILFLNGKSFDFQLRVQHLRREAIRDFYAALGKAPREVFPLTFAAAPGLTLGITSGLLEGFYDFPLGNTQGEFQTGAKLFCTAGLLRSAPPVTSPIPSRSKSALPNLQQISHLTQADLQRNPLWIRIPFEDSAKPWFAQHAYVPYLGPRPANPEEAHLIIGANFFLQDGTEYPGYVRAVPENWLDILPPPTRIGPKVIQGPTPRERFGGSPLGIVGEHFPVIFTGEQSFGLWCGPKDCDEVRLAFYQAVGKSPAAIFPIRFAAVSGLALGIVAGELQGFYRPGLTRGKPPKVSR